MAGTERRVMIVTDEAADFPRQIELRRKLGVELVRVIPIGLTIGKDSFVVGESENKDSPSIDNETFRKRINEEMSSKSGFMPKTNASLEIDFDKIYRDLITRDLDVVSIHVSQALSETIANATRVVENIKSDRVSIFDSQTVSMAQGFMVIEAEKMAANGATSNEIIEMLTELRVRITLRAVTPNLPFLVASGRVPQAKAMIGRILNLVPVIKIDHIVEKKDVEQVGMFKKRVKNQAVEWMESYVEKKNPQRVAIVDFGAKEDADELVERLIKNGVLPEDKIYRGDLGPVTSSHGGPGTWATVMVERK